MFQKNLIKFLLTAVILFVYAFSITPKIFLHNLIATHTDKNDVAISNGVEFSAIGFNCKCNNVVAESPFIPEEALVYFNRPFYFTLYAKPVITFFSFDKLYSELRGPPVV